MVPFDVLYSRGFTVLIVRNLPIFLSEQATALFQTPADLTKSGLWNTCKVTSTASAKHSVADSVWL